MLTADRIDQARFGFEVVGAGRRFLRYETTVKRALDIILALIGLIGSLPVWLAIVVAIRIDSGGPAIFVQDRVGIHGRRFRFYKFRSMYADAEQRLADLKANNEASGPVFKMRKDPRITRVGAFLRKSSLDELPQLINVLKGDMSLVGPRPPLPDEVAQYRPSDAMRLAVKPGLTCLWQIRGRSTVSFDEWMEFDREYIRNMSLWFDLKILLSTMWAVLSMRGAY